MISRRRRLPILFRITCVARVPALNHLSRSSSARRETFSTESLYSLSRGLHAAYDAFITLNKRSAAFAPGALSFVSLSPCKTFAPTYSIYDSTARRRTRLVCPNKDGFAHIHTTVGVDLKTAKVGAQQSQPGLPKVDIPDLSDLPRMSRRWYFETTPTGKEQFVSIKRSRSHHHRRHHHHHHHPEHDTIRVGRDEWNRLAERERCLDEANKSLVAEVSALKASLSAAQAEAHHLCHVVVPQLQGQINVLLADNDALRRSLDNAGNSSSKHCHELDRLKGIIAALEKEKCALAADNAGLKDKIKSLAKQLEQACGRRVSDLLADIDYWKDQVRYWKCKFEDTRRRHDDTCGMLEIRTEKMRAYEEILRRRRII